MNEEIANRIKGTLFGAACGNSLGGTALGMNRKEIMLSVGIRGVRDFTPALSKSLLPTYEPGTMLSDSRLATEIARSLLASGGVLNAAEMKQRLSRLLENKAFLNSSPGAHCLLPLRRMADDAAPAEKDPDSTHVSAASRAVFIGCLPNETDVIPIAIEQAKLSQADSRVSAAAAVIANSVHDLVSGMRLDTEAEVREFVRRQFEVAKQIEPAFADAWDDIAPDLDYINPADDLPYSLINVDSHVNEAVPTAVGVFLIFRHNFEEAVSAAASCGGDTDTVAAIVGALSGAYHGASAIPTRWLNRLLQREELEDVAEQFIGLRKERV